MDKSMAEIACVDPWGMQPLCRLNAKCGNVCGHVGQRKPVRSGHARHVTGNPFDDFESL